MTDRSSGNGWGSRGPRSLPTGVPKAVRVPAAASAPKPQIPFPGNLPYQAGPGERLLRTFPAEHRFLLREFLGGDGIVLVIVLVLGTLTTTGVALGGLIPGILPVSLLGLSLVTGVYLALEARATYRHQAVWVADQRVIHGYGGFKPRFQFLTPEEVSPGDVVQDRWDRRFGLARLALGNLRAPAERTPVGSRLTSSPEDRFVRGLTPRAAGELRQLLLSHPARPGRPPSPP